MKQATPIRKLKISVILFPPLEQTICRNFFCNRKGSPRRRIVCIRNPANASYISLQTFSLVSPPFSPQSPIKPAVALLAEESLYWMIVFVNTAKAAMVSI